MSDKHANAISFKIKELFKMLFNVRNSQDSSATEVS